MLYVSQDNQNLYWTQDREKNGFAVINTATLQLFNCVSFIELSLYIERKENGFLCRDCITFPRDTDELL